MPRTEALEAPVVGGAELDSGRRYSAASWLPAARGGWAHRLRGFAKRLTDAQLATVIGAVLFAISAWPLALVEVPPYQDLPNHLATLTVIQHPERYPEFVFNGFFKTNAALFTWLYVAGKFVGATMAARLFALMVLALNALVFPRFVLAMTGDRKKLVVASLFVWPMVHNWFVSMGMLDFALGVPLALLTLMALNRQRTAPSWKNALAITALAGATWYAHVFTLMVVHLLVLVHIVVGPREHLGEANAGEPWAWRARLAQAKWLLLPLSPTTVLVAMSLFKHVTEPRGAMQGFLDLHVLLPPWELAYNMFAEWFYGFTWLSLASLLPCLALGLLGLWRCRARVPFFSPLAFATLGVLFVTTPYITTNWFHVNSRFIPFLWMALLVRVPDRLPRALVVALGIGAVTYSIGMGVDFVRLDRDRAKFTAGVNAVPEGARLLPLIFSRKLTSENTRSLQHAWGFYVTEKQTSAPLLFAHSRSFPVMYKEPPLPQFNHLMIESFAPTMRDANWACDIFRTGGVFVNDCEGLWRQQWAEFWRQALPEYDHVLAWDATPEVRALVPPQYKVVFQQDRLTIYAREDALARTARK